jgi:mRNA-degrading endonuclease RelE of RelBE toxin-antitoxin system
VRAIEQYQTDVPDQEEGPRKRIAGVIPPWSDEEDEFWQLRVGPYRVWYGVAGQRVWILAAFQKRAHETTGQALQRLQLRRKR